MISCARRACCRARDDQQPGLVPPQRELIEDGVGVLGRIRAENDVPDTDHVVREGEAAPVVPLHHEPRAAQLAHFHPNNRFFGLSRRTRPQRARRHGSGGLPTGASASGSHRARRPEKLQRRRGAAPPPEGRRRRGQGKSCRKTCTGQELPSRRRARRRGRPEAVRIRF